MFETAFVSMRKKETHPTSPLSRLFLVESYTLPWETRTSFTFIITISDIDSLRYILGVCEVNLIHGNPRGPPNATLTPKT